MRIRHIFAAGDGGPESALGKPVALNLSSMFAPMWTITSAVETTIDGVVTLEERAKTRLLWKQQADHGPPARASPRKHETKQLEITVAPMEIRTFRITVAQ